VYGNENVQRSWSTWDAAWQASRKQASEKVQAHFNAYTNPTAGGILAEQVREILE